MSVRVLNPDQWQASTRAWPKAVRRGDKAPANAAPLLPPAMVPDGAVMGENGIARRTARRSAGAPPLELAVESAAGERVVMVTRLPSGALRFHAPVEHEEGARRGRGARASAGTARFVIPSGPGRVAAARRGLTSDAIEWAVVKIKKGVVDKVIREGMKRAAAAAEKRWWGKAGEGLFRVEEAGGKLQLTRAAAGDVHGPALMFLHGTFSNAESAFGTLAAAPGQFFAAARHTYGRNIFAWNHYTVSKSPEENAQELLAALPAGATEFDVITHSRGGLVLRLIAERPDLAGPLAGRFRLRRAVLVAAPNGGTPLVTPGRWEQTLGAVANVLDLFPDNPWSMGAKFVADGIVWLAGRLSGDLPGLHSMDADGETIASLEESAPLEHGRYSALAANFHPAETLWQRLLDAGVDAFFAGASDLVVPTEGSWLAGDAGELVPAERIGCFGEGGNLSAGATDVHHLNFFREAATVDFLLKSLGLITGPMPPPLDPDTVMRARKLRTILHRGGPARGTPPPVPLPLRKSPALPASLRATVAGDRPDTAYLDRALHLLILNQPGTEEVEPAGGVKRQPMILATYSNARMLEPFPVSNGAARKSSKPKSAGTSPVSIPVSQLPAGTRFSRIIAMDRVIRQCLDGVPGASGGVPELPDDEALALLGELLFRALLVGDIRRLYDTARAEQHGRPLNIVLTCAVPWVAALPWEFAFDPVRRKYLASEEVHFTRGVMAAVPAEVIRTKSQRLRILVVGAQPRDVTPLSIAEEEQRLRHAFHALTDEGLAEIETLLDASPGALHEYLFREQIAGRSFDIVHFISHGEFAPGADEGRLLFTGRDGWQQEVEVRPLREMLCSRGIHLVFLNACESGTGWKPSGGTAGKASRRSRERGVAQALVEGGLPAVVANQYTVLDSSAVAFSECFYRALALGASLGQAAREARIALNYAVDGEAIDWAVPVLYARDPEVRLCPVQAHGSGALPPARAVAVRRSGPVVPAADGWRIRVAVADISRYFPQLDALLVSMNKAQECFEFVTAEVTIPLGVWEQYEDKETGERTRYLHAQRFARKVKAQPQRLGVDFLFCVTNHWMRDGDFYNLYGWWSSDRDCRVLLFSTQGLSLPAEGTAAGRVVANAVVQTLAAQMAEEMQPKPLTKPAIHEKGAADCPFFGNVERTSDIIAGRLKFDTLCKKYLRTHLPERFGNTNRTEIIRAFDQLLRAF